MSAWRDTEKEKNDPHSAEEQRFIIIGASEQVKSLWLLIQTMEIKLGLSVLAKQRLEKESPMNKVESEEEDDLQPEYDFSQMQGGVRGKYVERYRQGTNLVLLDPDIAAAFPDAKAVNDALRLLLQEKQSPQPR